MGIHAGRSPVPDSGGDQQSIKVLCNLYLDYQESRAAIGEVKPRHVSDQVFLLKAFVKFVGSHRLVSDISTVDLQNYRKELIQAGSSPNTINNRIAAVKAMYNWASDN
jgi:site-specific recombinase XerD